MIKKLPRGIQIDEMAHCQNCLNCVVRQAISKVKNPSQICQHSIHGICTLEEAKIPHTLEEIGMIMGVTRERIRQIELKAIKKLRHPKRAIGLKPFYLESIANTREPNQPLENFGG